MSSPNKPAEDNAAPEKKKSKKKLMIIMAGVVLLVVVGAGYFMMSSKKAPAAATAPEPGAVNVVDAVTINLADGHYLKIQIAIQEIKGIKSTIDNNRVADLIITEYTNLPMAQIASNDGRDKTKSDLLSKLEAAFPKEIMDLYFTQFVMQ